MVVDLHRTFSADAQWRDHRDAEVYSARDHDLRGGAGSRRLGTYPDIALPGRRALQDRVGPAGSPDLKRCPNTPAGLGFSTSTIHASRASYEFAAGNCK